MEYGFKIINYPSLRERIMAGMRFTGKVMDVFKNTDGDYHVHILVDNEYRNLLKVDFVVIQYAWLLRIISFVLSDMPSISPCCK